MPNVRSIIGSLLDKAPVPVGRGNDLLLSIPVKSRNRREKHLGAMETQATLFAITDRIASSVASATWHLYRKARRAEDRVEVRDHPALTVWNDPNPHYTQDELVETNQQHYELTGEWWWIFGRSETLRGGGWPLEIWPVRPDRMFPIPSKSKFTEGYLYVAGRDQVRLETTDVAYMKRPNPLDPYRGLSPVGTLLLDIEGETAASEWNVQFFRNGAEPGGLLKTQGDLTDPEWEKLQERWRRSHQGVGNAHRVGVLEGGMEWVDRRYTQRDMQFEQLRRYSKDNIRTAWGFPKPLLGDVEDVNRANAEAGEVVFSRWLAVPRLNKIRTLLNRRFLPLFPAADNLEFDYDPVIPPNTADLREDLRMRGQLVVSLVAQGYDPTETLKAFDLPAITFVGRPTAPAPAVEPDNPETDTET